MRFRPLTNEEKAATGGATHRLDFSARDFPAGVANNTDVTFDAPDEGVPAIPASCIIKRVLMHLTTPFEDLSDTAFNSVTVDLGDTANGATYYLSGVQINRNGTEVIDTFPGAHENVKYTAVDQLALNFNSMSGKSLSDIDKGQLYILLWIDVPTDRIRGVPA